MENSKTNRNLFTVIVILLLAILALIVFGIIPCSRKEKSVQAWCYDFKYDIGRDERSNDVKALQLALQKEGLFDNDINGLFDDDTADAVIAFQQKYPSILAGIGASLGTAYVDEATRNKLNELYACEGEPEQIEWATYRNEDYRYEIGYPNVLTDGGEYIPEDALHKMWRRNSSPSSWESLNVYVSNSQYSSFEQLWANVNKQAEEKFSTAAREKCIDSFDKIEIQEYKGSKVFYNFKAGCVAPPDTVNSEAIILRGNRTYRIFHSCASGLDCRERFNQILERFKFLEEGQPAPTPTPTPTPTPAPTPTPTPTPIPPAPALGDLNVQTSSSVPENQKYQKGEIAARLIKIDFTAGSKENVKISELSLQIKRNADEYSTSILPKAGDLQDLRLQKDDGTYFGLIADTVEGQKTDGSTINFSGDLLVEAGSTKSLTLVADISATTTASFFETAIPMAYTSSWVKSTGASSNNDITESGGARRKVLIEGQRIVFIGGGGGGGGRREEPVPPIEEYVTVSLSSDNPASRDIIPPEAGAGVVSSELMLVFNINNPFDREVAISELAVLLEGTATSSDFGDIIWQSEGNLVGWSQFDSNGYARAPFPSTAGYDLPLLKVAAKSTKTVKVFVYLDAGATVGGIVNIAIPEQKDYLISSETITGFPIRGHAMTIKTEQAITVSLSSENPASRDIIPPEAGAGVVSSELMLVFNINNPFDREVAISELAVLLEGTATSSDFGDIIWQSEGKLVGWSQFDSNGYARAPFPSTQGYELPLLKVAPKSTKTVKVFVYLDPNATIGKTVKLTLPKQADYLISNEQIIGFPIVGNLMTVKEQKNLIISLCCNNPISHQVAASASYRPADLLPSGLPSTEVSHLFLCFEIQNTGSEDIAVKDLGIKLEGTALPEELGEIIWVSDEKSIGGASFGLPGFDYAYAKIPNPYDSSAPLDPLMVIPAGDKKAVKVFAYVKHDAVSGHTIKFTMPEGNEYLNAPGAKIEGMPIAGNQMTITNQVLELKLESPTLYSVDAQPGQTLSAAAQLYNPYVGRTGLSDSGEVFITQIFLGDGAGNAFLERVDKESLEIRFKSPEGQIVTSQLRDTGRTAQDGSRIFDIIPSLELAQQKTTDFLLSLKISDSAPKGTFTIKITNVSAYGGSTFSPVALSDLPSIEINVVK